ncbi:MAG TPA: glycosyltransferase, partial [Pyrinomonadaceae bacterium]
AMACGAPVIASRIPALTETTGAAARLFDPQNVPELARNIIELLDDKNGESLRRQLSTAGQRRAAEFSWENTARQTMQVYAEGVSRFGKKT